MRVHLLGTGGYHPSERRHTACVMLPECGVVFDAGTSAFRIVDRLQTDDIDIFLTHAHLDHIVGLTFLLPPLLNGRLQAARVHAQPPVIRAVREHLFSEPLFPVDPRLEFVELADRVETPGGTVTHCRLDHPGGSVGYRLDGPERSLAYITDTVADGSYVDFVGNVDLLIHECYFPDDKADWARETGHSHTSAVAAAARDARVGRLLLVHVDPLADADDPIGLATARSVFPETELAYDLLDVEV